ncbi:MAG: PIN domain-containing protein [Verrucomicrobiales bacterium]|nr:PIN domain-containing protein [Verrucomicrobiales bacterium]
MDANVVLRFLTQDHPARSKAATALFAKAKNREVTLALDPVILAEVIYNLEAYYQKSREEIANTLLQMVTSLGVAMDPHGTVINALLRYKNQPVDFPDAWLASLAGEQKLQAASFDKDLDRFSDVTRHEPKA